MDSSWLIKGIVFLFIAISLGIILWFIRRKPKKIIKRRKVLRAKMSVQRKVVVRKRVVKRRNVIKKRKPARRGRRRS